MEILVGPTFTINDVPSSPPPSDQTDGHRRLFMNEDQVPTSFRISGPSKFFGGGSPESSSSIGTPDESDNDEEVQSQMKTRSGLGSLDSLEDSLPIKFVPFFLSLYFLSLLFGFMFLFNFLIFD